MTDTRPLQPVHASLVAWHGPEGWSGVLIQGPSGSGKSTLALQALASGARLVADDRVILWRSGADVYGRPAEVLAGLIEVRGVGVVECADRRPFAPIRMVVDLSGPVDRLPAPETTLLLGLSAPRLTLDMTRSAPLLRLRAALAAVQRRL